MDLALERDRSHPVRVYEDWQGNEVFFCWGRLVAGPNWKSLFGTSLLILAPLVVYVVLVGQVLMDDIHFAVPLVGLVLGVMALIFLFTTGCMDPGILQRKEPDDLFLTGRKPKTNEVTVNGFRVMVRYNETCHFYQPPRAHHCSVNDNCIEKFDHHCPWVGTTIGLRNYRFFLSFIFTASLLCIYVCATAVVVIKLEYDNLNGEDKDLKEALKEAPAAIAVALYSALFFLFVGGLSFFHMYLVSTNQTTYENFRYGYDRESNPYNEGCFANCWSVWCTPIPKSKVDCRAFILPKRSCPSSTVQTSTVGDESFRDYSRGNVHRHDMEMTNIGMRLGQMPEGEESSSLATSSPRRYRLHHTGERSGSRNAHYQHRPYSAMGPSTDMEIQVVRPGSTYEEPPNNLRRYYSDSSRIVEAMRHQDGPEVRMFPRSGSNAFRPTSVPYQDGVTPRPRPASQIPRRPM